MSFRSKAQIKWAFRTGQYFARRWAEETDPSQLPERIHPKPVDRNESLRAIEAYLRGS